MLVRLNRKKVFYWNAQCNSSVNNKTIISFPEELAKINTKFVPQVGDEIEIMNHTYTVKRIARHFGKRKNDKVFIDSFIDLYVDSEFFPIPYYDYLREYTHSRDHLKEDSDPTKDLSKVNDKVVLPSTLEEWLDIYENLKDKND